MHSAPAWTPSNGESRTVKSINRKLLRELWQLKGQMFSIALVVATGIMTVITMRGSYDSLVQAQQSYYRQARFADIWAPPSVHPRRCASTFRRFPVWHRSTPA